MVSKLLLRKIKTYLKKSKLLEEINHEQKSLKPPVSFRQRKNRVDKLQQIKDEGNQILEKIFKEKNVPKRLINGIKSMIAKTYYMKRENCLLLFSGPLGVLKPKELCIFREKSRNNIIEVRKYFGLHKNLFYDDGLSVAMAYTRPKLLQNYHTHGHMNEYTTVLSGSIIIKAKIGKRLKTLKANEGDIIFAERYTVHTLQNNSTKNSLNVTVKLPIGFHDRTGIDQLPENQKGKIKIIKLKRKKEKWGESKHETIKENGFAYKITFLTISPTKSLKLVNKKNTVLYVIRGNIEVTGSQTKKRAKKNYLIFTQEDCIIKNLSKKTTAKVYYLIQL